MNSHFTQSMRWLHIWAGLIVSWLLYFMFITGTMGYFDEEIDHWMRPEIQTVAPQNIDQAELLTRAENKLQQVGHDSPYWFIYFPYQRSPYYAIEWQDKYNPETKTGGDWHYKVVDIKSDQFVETRDTGGGQTLYHMHYALHYMPYQWAAWITSFAALLMFIGLITGIIIHRKIFKNFFTFRPKEGKRAWLDLHNLFSVLPLPFHLMITYTGLIFMMFVTMQYIVNSSFGFDPKNIDIFYQQAFPEADATVSKEQMQSPVPLQTIYTNAQQYLKTINEDNTAIKIIGISHRKEQDAHVNFDLAQSNVLTAHHAAASYSLYTGERLIPPHQLDEKPRATFAYEFHQLMVNLHMGQFADTGLRWLYFISGLMGAGMIATGSMMWARKRREKAEKTGEQSNSLKLVESLNIGTIIGLPCAIAVYFLANRLLPVTMAERAQWEVNCLFLTWLICLLYPLFAVKFRQRAQLWRDQLLITSLLYYSIPVVNALTTSQHLANTLIESIDTGNWNLAVIDLSFLITGTVCFYAANRFKQQTKQSITKQLIVVGANQSC